MERGPFQPQRLQLWEEISVRGVIASERRLPFELRSFWLTWCVSLCPGPAGCTTRIDRVPDDMQFHCRRSQELDFGHARELLDGPHHRPRARYSHMTGQRRSPMKARKKRSATNTAFRPGRSGECEAQLWMFRGPRKPGIPNDDHRAEMRWVAAESLDAALVYLRQRHDDFTITQARFRGMIPLLSGSPLD